MPSRCKFSTSWISRHSESLRFRTVAGIVLLAASFDARKRRAPATNSYMPASPSGAGRTRIACKTPCNRMLSANSRSLVSSKIRRGLVVDSRILSNGISRTEEPPGGTVIASLATVVVFISFLVLSSQAFGLILFGQKQGRRTAVCLSDNPQLATRVRSIAAQEPESVLKAVVVFVLVLVGQIAPVAGDMPPKEITLFLASL